MWDAAHAENHQPSLSEGEDGARAGPHSIALVVLKQCFRTNYRGLVQMVADLPDVRGCLGLKRLPQYPTLCSWDTTAGE
jgi:hypothetical protein